MFSVQKLEVTNWRNFGEATMTLPDRLFIVGANAAGKSNLMDVLRFLKDIATNGLIKSIDGRGGIKKIRYLFARDPSYVEIKVDLLERTTDANGSIVTIPWQYALQFNSRGGTGKNTAVNISLEQIIKNDQSILTRRYNDETEDYVSRQFTHLEQPATNMEFRGIYEFFKSISYVNIIPQLIRTAGSLSISNMPEDYYGRNLLETMADTNERTRKTRINAIAKILEIVVPQLSRLEFIKDDKGYPHLRVRYQHFRPHGAFQQEDQFSDGTLRLIGLIWAIIDGDGLLLLEEPELYLHSEIVKQLPIFIEKAQKQKNGIKRQVIISSHSFDILNTNTISPSEIAILQPEKEGTTIKLASTLDEVKELIEAGFTPADAVVPLVTPKGISEGQLSLFEL